MLNIKKLIAELLTSISSLQGNISSLQSNMFNKNRITHGQENVGTISANAYKDVIIDHNLGSGTHVVACLYSSGTASNIGSVCVAIMSTSPTQATIRVFNDRSATINPAIRWIAVN